MPNEPYAPSEDDLRRARLDRLSQRRAPAPPRPTPRPLPPPVLGPPLAGAHDARRTAPPAMRTRRRHPAATARVGALIISCAATGGLAYLLGTTQTSSAGAGGLSDLPAPLATTPAPAAPSTATTAAATTAAPATTAPSTAGSPAATTGATSATSATAPPTTPAAAAVVAFDGDVINTRYGPVQVQAQVSSGSLVEVAVIQYPDNDRKSVRINERALPTLRTEALSAQSAQVDTVSGATYTSDGYATSLQSALDQAAAAGAAVTA